jgi:hypothetical protein
MACYRLNFDFVLGVPYNAEKFWIGLLFRNDLSAKSSLVVTDPEELLAVSDTYQEVWAITPRLFLRYVARWMDTRIKNRWKVQPIYFVQ